MYSRSSSLNDLQQKVRTRPIKITDIAIDKVRQTRITGFTNEENKYIQDFHKQLLRISKTQNNSEEVAITIDIIQWSYQITIGNGNRVIIKNDPIANRMLKEKPKNTLLVMHNHPSTSTFSGKDFKTFCDYESIYTITIVGNDGSVQVMTKDINFNGINAKIKYYELANDFKAHRYKNNATKAMHYVIKHPEEFGIIYKHGGKKQ